jgi:hypothetical protein
MTPADVVVVLPAHALAPRQIPTTITATSATATSTASSDGGDNTLTGAFTAPQGAGVYQVTSVSGVVQVAGHRISAGGPDALVGGVRVTVGSAGVEANGQTVALAEVTSTSSSSSMMMGSSVASVTATGAVAGATGASQSTGTSDGGAAVATAGLGAAAAVIGGLFAVLV